MPQSTQVSIIGMKKKIDEKKKLFMRSEKFASHLDINKFNVSPVMAPKRPIFILPRVNILKWMRENVKEDSWKIITFVDGD